MATFEKTWAFDLNRGYTAVDALDLTRYQLWYLAAALTGNIGGFTLGLWTLHASSDSVTAGTDSTDRWVLAGPYDGTKIVRGATVSPHSWIVLKSPSINGNVWYMILSFNTAADTSVRISFCKTAPTGGSTTATPTAANQWWPSTSTGTSLTVADVAINAGLGDILQRFSLVLSTVGDFIFVGSRQGSLSAQLGVMFHGLANYQATDLYPVFTCVSYNTVAALTYVNSRSPFDSGGTAAPGAMSLMPTGPVATASNAIMVPGFYGNLVIYQLTSTSFPALADGSWSDFPCWVWHNISANTIPLYLRGRIPDLAIAMTSAVPFGAGSPNVGSVDSVKVGNLWIPANAALNFA